jgi:Rps23 Pro-64 3,4-dihydroxylase Tpa1-like proline 4-hydroxylase
LVRGAKVEITHSCNQPFDYWILDNFLPIESAKALYRDFDSYESGDWYEYNSPLEKKKSNSVWWKYPPTTYSFLKYLCNDSFVDSVIREITGYDQFITADEGLHGAGWHIHANEGKLNIHLDYSIHPKLGLERKYNLIYYLSEDWNPEWGGNLELWSGDNKKAEKRETAVDCVFNRAILFDTTQNSWHGFPTPICCSEGVYRKSIAMYYLTIPQQSADLNRKRALYMPSKEQEDDAEVLDLIKSRVKI